MLAKILSGKTLHFTSLLLFAALITGCGVSNTNNRPDNTSSATQTQTEFAITNDLPNRMKGNNSPRQAKKIKTKKEISNNINVQVTFITGIESPAINGKVSRASNLSYNENTNQIYVGYKILGEAFGGGIDVIDAEDPRDLQSGVLSIASNNLDVQEVAFDNNAGALYVAGAVEPVLETDSTSRLSRLTFNNNGTQITSQIDRALAGNVAKSLVVDDEFVHVVDDEQTLYQFDLFLSESSRRTLTVAGADFRSVAQMNNSGQPLIFVLNQRGEIYRANKNSFNDFQESIDLLSNEDSTEANAIARLQAHVDSSPPLLLAALNRNGFAVTNPAGTQTWTIQSGQFYTSVTGLTLDGTTYIFAASPDGTIEMYLDNFQQTTEEIAQFNINDITNGFVGAAQVNDIIAVNTEGESDKLYIANGEAGLIVLELFIRGI